MNTPTISCIYCGTPTLMFETQQCNGCWEISHRVGSLTGPEIQKILTDQGFVISDGSIFAPEYKPTILRSMEWIGKQVASMVRMNYGGLEDNYREKVLEEALTHWAVLIHLRLVEENEQTVQAFIRGVEKSLDDS